jgi:hypothetical protein
LFLLSEMKNGKCWLPTICFVFIIWDEERQMLAPDNLGFLFNYLRWRTVNAESRQSVSNFTLYKIFSCWSTIVSFLDWIKWKTKQQIPHCRNSSKNLITKFDTPYTKYDRAQFPHVTKMSTLTDRDNIRALLENI